MASRDSRVMRARISCRAKHICLINMTCDITSVGPVSRKELRNGGQDQSVSPEKQARSIRQAAGGVSGCATPNDLRDGGGDLCSQHAGGPSIGARARGESGGL